jgi:Uma2 family endonuclease
MAVSTQLKVWSLEELHSLPDDGNKYELIRGELFVTPAPTLQHETILARLTRILDPYVAAQRLGYVYHPRAVVRLRPGSEVEPDLFVSHPGTGYDHAPIPALVVEVHSPFTRRRDQEHKRRFYLDDLGVPEYWMLDPERRSLTAARRGVEDTTTTTELAWFSPGAAEALSVDVAALFGEGDAT